MKEKAKQKAIELFEKFQDTAERHRQKYQSDDYGYMGSVLRENKKKCALIAVDLKLEGTTWFDPSLVGINGITHEDTEEYWNEVKNQLNQM